MNLKPLLWSCAMLAPAWPTFGAEIPKAPVPPSPFIRVVYGYADAMLKSGRDNYGPEKTGLFLSALDRHTLAPLTNRPNAPEGVRSSDRVGAKEASLVGANPHHDQTFFRLLYTLSELSAKPHYRAAADAQLQWYLEHAPSLLLPAGKRMSWDVMHDQIVVPDVIASGTQELFRPWMLWDRCFELAPEASKSVATQVTNATDSAEHAGSRVRTWAAAYAHTKDEQFIGAIDSWLSVQERTASLNSPVSLAIDCDGAAHHVAQPLAARLRAFAAVEDERFCSLPHDVKSNKGFLVSVAKNDSVPTRRYTPLWEARSAGRTTAQVGMMCVSRYDNTGKVGYRDLVLAAADSYLDSLPGDQEDAWPATFGHAISLELAAWRHSANWKYMERARKLGDNAVEKFWGTNALPRASLQTDHYETITGADTLALALLELHLQILHITAVRCPPNTIDR